MPALRRFVEAPEAKALDPEVRAASLRVIRHVVCRRLTCSCRERMEQPATPSRVASDTLRLLFKSQDVKFQRHSNSGQRENMRMRIFS